MQRIFEPRASEQCAMCLPAMCTRALAPKANVPWHALHERTQAPLGFVLELQNISLRNVAPIHRIELREEHFPFDSVLLLEYPKIYFLAELYL